MTRSQRLALRWLEEHCSVRGIVRVSNSEIALILGWSQPHAKRILSSLVDDGYLEILQKGTGHRATKYQILSSSHTNYGSSHTSVESTGKPPRKVAHHVPSHNQNSSQETSKTVFPKNSLPFRYVNAKVRDKENAQRVARIRNGTVFDNVPSLLKAVKTRSTPFKRFKTHCDNVDQWRPPDFVCYFSYIFRVRWGETAEINWPMELGAARTLLNRLAEPWMLKVFIQTAAIRAKKKPNGLRSYTNDYAFRDIIAQQATEDELEEYCDDYVFPWLWEKAKAESHQLQQDYDRHLLKTYLGL